MNLIEYT